MSPDARRHSTADRDYIEHVEGNVTIYNHGDGSSDAAARLKERDSLQSTYLHHLMRQMNQIDLSGIDRKAAGHNSDTCLQLSAIYTALLTLGAEHLAFEMGASQDPRTEAYQGRRLSALAQVNQHQRLVLLGDPGSGKSTFVKFVAMCLAGALLKDDDVNLALLTTPLPEKERDDTNPPAPQSWEHDALLPVLVVLRDFAAGGLPPEGQPARAKHLWEFIAKTLDGACLKDYAVHLQRQLRDQGGLILLDGLDEVPEAARRRVQIKQVVEDVSDTFPLCRVVVTSRTYAYQQQEWRLQGFAEAALAPFSEAQIGFFVEHWYGHMARMRGMDRENARGRAELLKRTIFHSERLQDFAKRPLLLTLMASLHAWRGGSLPEKRGELYAEATDLLLDWWERNKMVPNAEGTLTVVQPSLTEMLRVGKDAVQQVLRSLAFEAHSSQTETAGTADIPEERLIGRLMLICRNEQLNPLLLMQHLSDRAGLLVPRGVEIYGFPHRSFQEYLAACYLTDQEDYPDNVADLARKEPNRWRETVLLAGAKGVSGIAASIWSLAEALCYQELDEDDVALQDSWGALLAGQALIESAKLDTISPRNRPKVKRIQKWLVAILTEQMPKGEPFPAVERALAGNILAQLGDLRPGVGLREDGLPDIAWCEVPAGEFVMGSDPKRDPYLKRIYKPEREQPQHTVYVSSFQISRYPVTNAQYLAFMKDDGYGTEAYWTDEAWDWKKKKDITEPDWARGEFDLLNHPVVGVSCYEASAFCNWLTQRLQAAGELKEGQELRLPTEAEWEKAARGDDGRIFPWGDEDITPELANYGATDLGVTSAVGCFSNGSSPYGCEDMAGNVYEWCADWYVDRYYSKSPDRDPQGPASGSYRVGRGGAWNFVAGSCRAAYRFNWRPAGRSVNVGFRLLRTPS